MRLLPPTIATLLMVTILPEWSALFAFLSMLCLYAYIYCVRKGGSLLDDYGRSMIEPGYFASEELRTEMQGNCLKCRISFIFCVLFMLASFVVWVKA